MNLYQKVTRYNQYNGEPFEVLDPYKKVCDFCGRAIPIGGDDDYDYDNESSDDVLYKIYENSWSEAQFSQLELSYDGKRIDLYDLFGSHEDFVYCRYWNEPIENCEKKLMMTSGSFFTLYDAMYEARIKMLKKLFEEGKFQPEDFKLSFS